METQAEFVWADAKASANEAKHSVRFDYAAAVFLDNNRLDLDTTRADDGEERRKANGIIEGKLYTVVPARLRLPPHLSASFECQGGQELWLSLARLFRISGLTRLALTQQSEPALMR